MIRRLPCLLIWARLSAVEGIYFYYDFIEKMYNALAG